MAAYGLLDPDSQVVTGEQVGRLIHVAHLITTQHTKPFSSPVISQP
jgi:hypothetical protein